MVIILMNINNNCRIITFQVI